ncbi:D-alanine--D-alanine ligase family protein [Qiania dongpingensis]|uniref:D-alanine--D-alanine ligase n=1 Tax=Qiania dongpingensis TaxID=2763669 RepID=A0A7G9G7E4_9FIRM|nr:D-alanine--D-alanine ligase family protein [Qiania dongpingensis]QNM06726.1 D-alanine--D-alanine ligase [Qiania dongpingensis]
MTKQTVAVLFGGQSSEHEISCISAVTVIENINTDKYDTILIGITQDGKWIHTESVEEIRSGAWVKGKTRAVLSPDADMGGVLLIENGKAACRKVDVIFPVLHGLYGEDGTVQGIFELSQIPYVGCGVLASSVSMDKLYTKIIVDTLGIRQAKYAAVRKEDLQDMDAVVKRVEETVPYPVFIKPCNAGSSRGVSKAENREMLTDGLLEAVKHDRKILVEETIVGREIECAVLGGNEVKASGVGEILAAAEFYDYEAKYHNAESKTVMDPELPAETVEELRRDAVAIFKAVDGFGLSRVDFFVTKDTGEVVFNELNTLPGFTSISMYPMLWENRGIAKPQLIEKLIQMAFSRKEK